MSLISRFLSVLASPICWAIDHIPFLNPFCGKSLMRSVPSEASQFICEVKDRSISDLNPMECPYVLSIEADFMYTQAENYKDDPEKDSLTKLTEHVALCWTLSRLYQNGMGFMKSEALAKEYADKAKLCQDKIADKARIACEALKNCDPKEFVHLLAFASAPYLEANRLHRYKTIEQAARDSHLTTEQMKIVGQACIAQARRLGGTGEYVSNYRKEFLALAKKLGCATEAAELENGSTHH